MLRVRIEAWNYSPGGTGTVRDSRQVFNATLDDQAKVADLQRRFQQPRGGGYGGSAQGGRYRYACTFFQNGIPVQTYTGSSSTAMWQASEGGGRKTSVASPGSILHDLHRSLDLPV
jgi:hypothetical protein